MNYFDLTVLGLKYYMGECVEIDPLLCAHCLCDKFLKFDCMLNVLYNPSPFRMGLWCCHDVTILQVCDMCCYVDRSYHRFPVFLFAF